MDRVQAVLFAYQSVCSGLGVDRMRKCVVLLLVGLVAACEGSEPPADTGSVSTSTTAPTATSTTVDEGPLDIRMSWVAEAFSSGEVSGNEYQATFTADFIEAVPHGDFLTVLQQLGGGKDWGVGEFESREGVSGVALLVADDGETLRANMTLETVSPYRIAGLLMQPGEPPSLDDAPDDFEGAASRLAELGDLELAVLEVNDDECAPVFESGSGEPMPVGSAIKLYVLAAVAEAVVAGDLEWDTDIPITEEHRSIPTGVLQDEEAGATFTVREMAETMIAFSDNTATDHLIGVVGRGAVESALVDERMEDPSLNVPFMNTMDFAALKIGPASGLATQWVEANEPGRRRILDQISDIHPSDLPLAEFNEPVLPDQIEWFATTSDMCRVLTSLYQRGEPLTQVLGINPGLPDEEGDFEFIAFKGGSEPGMVSMNWLVERVDGRVFVVSGSVVDPNEDFDQLEATLLFGAVRDLVADQ